MGKTPYILYPVVYISLVKSCICVQGRTKSTRILVNLVVIIYTVTIKFNIQNIIQYYNVQYMLNNNYSFVHCHKNKKFIRFKRYQQRELTFSYLIYADIWKLIWELRFQEGQMWVRGTNVSQTVSLYRYWMEYLDSFQTLSC